MFRSSLRDFLTDGPSSREKHLDKIFPIFVSRVLATWFGDLFVTHFSCKNRMFCALRTVFKIFFSFPSFTLTVHCLVHSSLSHKLTVFLTKILNFLHHLYFKLQEKV